MPEVYLEKDPRKQSDRIRWRDREWGKVSKGYLMTTVGTGAQSLWDTPKKNTCSSPRKSLRTGEDVDYLSLIGGGLLLAA